MNMNEGGGNSYRGREVRVGDQLVLLVPNDEAKINDGKEMGYQFNGVEVPVGVVLKIEKVSIGGYAPIVRVKGYPHSEIHLFDEVDLILGASDEFSRWLLEELSRDKIEDIVL
jgi:hypothetical protein